MTTITASAPATQVCTWNNLFPYSGSPEADVRIAADRVGNVVYSELISTGTMAS